MSLTELGATGGLPASADRCTIAEMDTHRKQVRHYHEPGDCHELTFSTYRRLPLLTDHRWQQMLSDSIDRAIERHAFHLAAFVFMPEHVHLLVYPTTHAARLDRLLAAIKRPLSYRIKEQLRESDHPLLRKLTVRERPGTFRFRFWQEGPGYDRNLSSSKAISAAVDYIHLNPVRRGLCENALSWKWSSARCYHYPEEPVDADLPSVHGFPPDVGTATN